MADQAYDDSRRRRMRRNMRQKSVQSTPQKQDVSNPVSNRLSFITAMDKPLLAITSLLLVIGAMMIFSTTFDWSNATRGNATAIFVEDHLRNLMLSTIGLIFFAVVDYRFWKRFAIWLLLITIGALISVELFGDYAFGARRSLIGGRFQPSELAEFAIVVYMAAWLGSKSTKVDNLVFGLIPFGIVVGVVNLFIIRQPDLSSAAVITMTASIMYFLAGANILHIGIILGLGGGVGLLLVQGFGYAQTRITDYTAGLFDPTQANYHTQQAIIAFLNGGWTGVGLGQSEQKFGALPAPHTDSIFAIIGEELGVLGASFVVLLFVAFAIRGFQIARNARDPFGALLCIGFTSWVIIQALLNIAVMTALVPSTGVPLPFISFGGSSLMVLMIGVGLMLSVQRIANLRQATSERRNAIANYDRGWGNRRARLSGTSNRGSPIEHG
jgi:cell division protein FtsW